MIMGGISATVMARKYGTSLYMLLEYSRKCTARWSTVWGITNIAEYPTAVCGSVFVCPD